MQIDISDYINQGVVFLDDALRVRMWNRWMETHSGLKSDQIVGKRLEDCYEGIADRSAYRQLCLAMENRTTIVLSPSLHRYLIPLKPGSTRLANELEFMQQMVRGCMVSDPNNGDGMLLFITDTTENYLKNKLIRENVKEITERRAELEMARNLLEEKAKALEQSNRYKSEFLANMSHEIRTPMNGIIGFTDLLLDDELTAEQREFLESIRLSASNLLMILNDILDLSKVEAGMLSLESIPIEVEQQILNVNELLRSQIDQKPVELLCRFQADIPPLRGDPTRLRQIFTNLIGNAIKFTLKGEIVSSVTMVNDTTTHVILECSVSDTGIGIPHDKLNTIFDAFTQVDGSTTREFGGTGLGLKICRKLVNMMGGDVVATSVPGHGTTFTFQIQLEKSAVTESGDVDYARSLSTVPRRCLIIDDSTTCLEIAADMLRELDIDVDVANDGTTGLRLFGETHYDFVLVDIKMPEIDGFEVLKRIRQSDTGSKAKLVAISGYQNQSIAHRIRVSGFDHCMYKPFGIASLKKMIMRLYDGIDTATEAAFVAATPVAHVGDLKLLLAEDNAVNQKLLIKMLAKMGHTAEIACNGKDAVNMATSKSYDLVFMDVEMPVMGGLDATKALREAGVTCPVIALTANAMSGDRKVCIDAGMTDYVTKPVSGNAIRDILRKYCDGCVPADLPRGKRLLLVDDNLQMVEMLKTGLYAVFPQFEVKIASDGFAACTLLGSFLPHLIILDIQMPKMDGIEFLRTIRNNRRFDAVRTIALTGLPEGDPRLDSARELAVDTIIFKSNAVMGEVTQGVNDILKTLENGTCIAAAGESANKRLTAGLATTRSARRSIMP